MKRTIANLEQLKYVIEYPEHFDINRKYPVIVCLHGAGGRGNNIDVLLNNPFFQETRKIEKFPFILIAPLCSENTWFDLWHLLKSLIRQIPEMPYVDEERIYMMGASMGGYATWQLAMSMPEYFAAIAPICGGGMYWNAARLVNTPVWAFHGARDTTVIPEESKKMVDAVNRAGGNAKLTIYPDNAHNAWSDTYSNPELYAWFLDHTNQNIKELVDRFGDLKEFG